MRLATSIVSRLLGLGLCLAQLLNLQTEQLTQKSSAVLLEHFLGSSDYPSAIGLGVDLRYSDFAVPQHGGCRFDAIGIAKKLVKNHRQSPSRKAR